MTDEQKLIEQVADVVAEYADNPEEIACKIIRKLNLTMNQLIALAGVECEVCKGSGTFCSATCNGTGRIKTHCVVPVAPTEEQLTNSGQMEGFDSDLFHETADKCHVNWYELMLREGEVK